MLSNIIEVVGMKMNQIGQADLPELVEEVSGTKYHSFMDEEAKSNSRPNESEKQASSKSKPERLNIFKSYRKDKDLAALTDTEIKRGKHDIECI